MEFHELREIIERNSVTPNISVSEYYDILDAINLYIENTIEDEVERELSEYRAEIKHDLENEIISVLNNYLK